MQPPSAGRQRSGSPSAADPGAHPQVSYSICAGSMGHLSGEVTSPRVVHSAGAQKQGPTSPGLEALEGHSSLPVGPAATPHRPHRELLPPALPAPAVRPQRPDPSGEDRLHVTPPTQQVPRGPLLSSAVAGTFQLLLRNQGAQRMSQSRSQTHLPAGGSGGRLRWAGHVQSTWAARVPAAPQPARATRLG